VQTDSVSEYSSETDDSDESETNYSTFDSNMLPASKLPMMNPVSTAGCTPMNGQGDNNTGQYILPVDQHCTSSLLPSPSVDKSGHLIQRSNISGKYCSSQVHNNSPIKTVNGNTSNNSYLTDCDKRNSSASLDSGRDSTYATGSEGSSGVQCPQLYSEDGCPLSTATTTSSSFFYNNNQLQKNNILTGARKISQNSSSCASFDYTSLPPAATMPTFFNHANSTTYNATSSSNNSSFSNYSKFGVTGSNSNLLSQYTPNQQANKDNTLTSPIHKYNSNSFNNNNIVHCNKNCCTTVNNNRSYQSQQQQPFITPHSPCQERGFSDFKCTPKNMPMNVYNHSQFPSSVQQYGAENQPYQASLHQHQQQQSHIPIHSLFISPDDEALFAWLRSVGLNRLSGCLSKSGFDLWTLCHTTPEELNACGITNPYDRQMLRNELAKLQLSDPITEQQLPTSVQDLLIQLHLQQYWPKLRDQGLITFEQIVRITWDDLEEIGILKLGHQKKFILAIRKLNRLIHDRVFLPPGLDQPTGVKSSVNKSFSSNDTVFSSQALSSLFSSKRKETSFDQIYNVQCQPDQLMPTTSEMIKDKKDSQQMAKHDISEIGIQVEDNLNSSPSSQCSSASATDSSSPESPYCLPPPVGFQDSPPTSSSSPPLPPAVLPSSLDAQNSSTLCTVNDQLLPSITSAPPSSSCSVQCITDVNKATLNQTESIDSTLPYSSSQNRQYHSQHSRIDQRNRSEPFSVFRRRSSNPNLYSLRPNGTVQNTNDLSKWSSDFLASAELRLPTK
ncbi:unnamed protein product, partial [Trichobilharzia szidati]